MYIIYVIGSDNIGLGLSADDADLQSAQIDLYSSELAEKLAAAYPDASIDVVVDNGSSKARVGGFADLDEAIDREEEILENVDYIASETWNHGNWHNG